MQKRRPEVTEILGDFECRGLLGPPGLDHGFLGGAMGWGGERAAPNRQKWPGGIRRRVLVGSCAQLSKTDHRVHR